MAWSVDVLDKYWGLIGLAIVVALEVFVFGSRGMVEWMLGAGIAGAALLIGWLVGYSF